MSSEEIKYEIVDNASDGTVSDYLFDIGPYEISFRTEFYYYLLFNIVIKLYSLS